MLTSLIHPNRNIRQANPQSYPKNDNQCCCYCCSVTKLCLTLCNPMDCGTPGFPVLHPFSEFAQNPCSLSQWCHPAISSSFIPFSSFPQSFPAPVSFPISWLFASGRQSTGASASASVLPRNTQGWFPLGLTGWISLQSKGLSLSGFFFFFLIPGRERRNSSQNGLRRLSTTLISLQSKVLSRVCSSTAIPEHQFLCAQPYGSTFTSIYDYWKKHSFDYTDLCWQSDVSAF